MRFVAGLLLSAFLALPAFAAQNGTVTFDLPNTGGAVTGACATATPATCGIRLFRDGTLIGPLSSGQSITALSPNDTGTLTLAVETWNAGGTARVTKNVTLGPPPPGPVRNLKITLDCETTSPPTCTVSVTDAP